MNPETPEQESLKAVQLAILEEYVGAVKRVMPETRHHILDGVFDKLLLAHGIEKPRIRGGWEH